LGVRFIKYLLSILPCCPGFQTHAWSAVPCNPAGSHSFASKRFVLVNAHAFLCILDYEPQFLMEKTNLMVSANNIQCYYMFKKEVHKINTVIESLMKQKRAGKDCKDVDSD
jgi:hypothetical protein